LSLLFIKLAREGLDGDIVELAEVPPQYESLIELTSFIGNSIFHPLWILFSHVIPRDFLKPAGSVTGFSSENKRHKENQPRMNADNTRI